MIAVLDDFKTAVRLAPDGSPASDPFVPDGFAAGRRPGWDRRSG